MVKAYVAEADTSEVTKKTWKEKLQVTPEHNAAYPTTQWMNYDLVPMPKSRRTWGVIDFFFFWMVGGFSVVNFASGAALVAFGLSGPEAIGCCILGPIILGLMSAACGLCGAKHHIGYTVSQRFSWGLKGSFFAVVLRCIPALIFDSIEAWWGGQAVAAMIGAMSIRFANWDTTVANGNCRLADLVGFFIFYVFFLLTMILPPEKLKRPFQVTTFGFACVVFGLLGWAVKEAGGAGPYFAGETAAPPPGGNKAWGWFFGLLAAIGTFSPFVIGQSDWTRFSSTPLAPTLCQIVVCPLAVSTASICGIVVASCCKAIFGVAYWQPYQILQVIQFYYNHSAGARAAVFLAGLASAAAQVNVNIILNSVSAAMDLSAIAPKYLNIRRAAYGVAITGLALNPWELLSTAGTFLNILAGFGVFYGTLGGIHLADYYVVRKFELDLPALYDGTPGGMYYFWKGYNWRAFASFALGICITMPGFIMSVHDPTSPDQLNPWRNIFRLAFFIGLSVSFVSFVLFSKLFPAQGTLGGTTGHIDGTFHKLDIDDAADADGEEASVDKEAAKA